MIVLMPLSILSLLLIVLTTINIRGVLVYTILIFINVSALISLWNNPEDRNKISFSFHDGPRVSKRNLRTHHQISSST